MQVARAFTGVMPSRTAVVAPRRVAVVAMAKPTKAADFQGLSNEELLKKVDSLKRELASTKWLQRTRGIEEIKAGENQPQPDPEKVPKGHLNRHLRRQVAQCLTVLRQRQIADGVSRKEARAIEVKAAHKAGALVA